MLRSGQRVDVQMVYGNGLEAQLRTILQNVEVLNVPAPESGRPVVNVLAKPEDAELLALADSSARIRLALRHPKDESAPVREPLTASAILRGAAATSRPAEASLAVAGGRLSEGPPPAIRR